MEITRRGFGRLAARAMLGIALGIGSMAGACSNVFSNILTYVGIGMKAFSVIVAMIGPAGAAVAPIIALIDAGWANLQAAVTEYDAAPAANKATLLGEIRTALQALEDNFTNFLAALPIGGTLETTIVNVVTLIVSTLAGYALKLLGAAARTIMLRSRTHAAQAVTPLALSPGEFKKKFNEEIAAGGYANYQIQ